jgi:hypothetical protein
MTLDEKISKLLLRIGNTEISEESEALAMARAYRLLMRQRPALLAVVAAARSGDFDQVARALSELDRVNG